MTKSTITREQLEEWVAQFDEDGGCDATDRQLEALIRQSLSAMDSEPVILYRQVNPANGMKTYWAELDPEEFRHLKKYTDENAEFMTLYRHAHPAPVVPQSISVREAISALESEDAVTTIGQAYKMGWNACRAAMLQELKKSAGTEAICRSNENVQAVEVQSLTSINPAPDLVSLQKKAEPIIGNYPGIPDGYVMVPKDVSPEQLRAFQLKTKIGAYVTANWSDAYDSLRELWDEVIAHHY